MPLTDLPSWIEDQTRGPCVWYVKRLQGNDTRATGSKQAGPYIPKKLLFELFPQLEESTEPNPRVEVPAFVDSQMELRPVRVIWYNNELREGTRNEARMTGFGGERSELLDPESTGLVTVFAFRLDDRGRASACHIWVANYADGDLIEDVVGPVVPGRGLVVVTAGTPAPERFCSFRHGTLSRGGDEADPDPPSVDAFSLVAKTVAGNALAGQTVDHRLLFRQEAFLKLSGRGAPFLVLPRSSGHAPCGGDVALALQLRAILEEEGFTEGHDFSFRPHGDAGPDFVFLVCGGADGNKRLHPMYVTRDLRRRWRKIVGIGSPGHGTAYVLTLQHGVGLQSFTTMREAGLSIVVPARLHTLFPEAVRSQILSLESWLADLRSLLETLKPARSFSRAALPRDGLPAA